MDQLPVMRQGEELGIKKNMGEQAKFAKYRSMGNPADILGIDLQTSDSISKAVQSIEGKYADKSFGYQSYMDNLAKQLTVAKGKEKERQVSTIMDPIMAGTSVAAGGMMNDIPMLTPGQKAGAHVAWNTTKNFLTGSENPAIPDIKLTEQLPVPESPEDLLYTKRGKWGMR
jgi:hypothetical protein